ncbi:MAG: hypothetical protein WC813_02830 [Patescibacteria group bacterium]|jgi:hypothetical protein
MRLQILRDHKFVEDVQALLTGERWLLEPTSTAIFNHHHKYQIDAKPQRQSWRKRGDMKSSDAGRYCVGCRWQVADHLAPHLLAIVPSISRKRAEAFINHGHTIVERRGQYSTRR